jgi:hypothetical protein
LQHAPTHTHSQTRHHAARRAAWLGLGLATISAALFTGGLAWLAHVAIDRAAGFGLRTRQGLRRG